ncbi:hypothetical protein M9458_016916 [Cirrhinus mrigala]|uniref:B30.2/SPRY domain-containing protein n=1 Tax=Cirrhinus mrigala TaxID=683832 RepID=A0ABD0QUC4_CIRMR
MVQDMITLERDFHMNYVHLEPKDSPLVVTIGSFYFKRQICFNSIKRPDGFHINSHPIVTFSLTPRPERLGVLLDYDGGQLSFYNVKESKHLLTISTRFSGSVVPLFNPGVGDQSSLTILDCPKPVESAVESSQPLLSNNSSDA